MRKIFFILLLLTTLSVYYSCSDDTKSSEKNSILGFWKQNKFNGESSNNILEFNKDSMLIIYRVAYGNNYIIEQTRLFNIVSETQIVIDGKNLFYKIENGKLEIYDENQDKYFQYPFISCQKPDVITEDEMIQHFTKEENEAIDRFIAENGFIVTNNSAEMYNDKVYFKTKEGLYIHVIDSGNGNKAEYNQEVLVRFRDLIDIKTVDTLKESNELPGDYAVTFRYNNVYTYGNDYYGLSCAGLSLGLNLVSENAEVSLIIPSALQSSARQSLFDPMYYGFLKYRLR